MGKGRDPCGYTSRSCVQQTRKVWIARNLPNPFWHSRRHSKMSWGSAGNPSCSTGSSSWVYGLNLRACSTRCGGVHDSTSGYTSGITVTLFRAPDSSKRLVPRIHEARARQRKIGSSGPKRVAQSSTQMQGTVLQAPHALLSTTSCNNMPCTERGSVSIDSKGGFRWLPVYNALHCVAAVKCCRD